MSDATTCLNDVFRSRISVLALAATLAPSSLHARATSPAPLDTVRASAFV